MDDFIAQNWILGDILVLWAIIFLNKNAKKAQISGFGRYFPLSLCSIVRIWALSTWPPWKVERPGRPGKKYKPHFFSPGSPRHRPRRHRHPLRPLLLLALGPRRGEHAQGDRRHGVHPHDGHTGESSGENARVCHKKSPKNYRPRRQRTFPAKE